MRLNVVTMPEAAVHENGGMVRSHDDVGFSWHAFHVEAVAVSVVPQPTSDQQFRFGVAGMDSGHAAVALGGGEAVGHSRDCEI